MLIKETKKDNLICKVFSDRDDMGKNAAKVVSDKIKELLNVQDTVNVVFAAAPSQNDVLKYLVQADVDWGRVNAFHMDEYIGLEPCAKQTFANYLKEHIFDKVNFKKVNYIGSGVVDLVISNYEKLLKENAIDIVCLGIGENAHIAFNDPWTADFEDEKLIKVVELDQTCRNQQVNDGCFESIDKVPKQAVTLTIPTLCSAKFMCCVVPTKLKANAVYNTMTKDITTEVPSTILRKHANAIMFTDADAASLL